MITFTQAAQDQIAKLCGAGFGTHFQRFLRIGVLGGGCSGFRYAMQFEERTRIDEEVDTTFFANGTGCVLVDQMSYMYLDGVEVDYETGITASGFTFKNPQVKSTCGCGQSFSV
jgi:iron-sulfur cluster insertion protein